MDITNMKIIFLDIDGVLNSSDSIRKRINSSIPQEFASIPDECHVKLLNKIVSQTGAKVVISSVWRKFNSIIALAQILYLCGLKNSVVIGSTPVISGKTRGTEIKAWLNNNIRYNVEKFVILDDDSDMNDLKNNLVQTTYEHGLTNEDANRAIEILNS